MNQPKASDSTTYTHTLTSTPGTTFRSPGGSILGDYSPDPFHPLPRAFESHSSYPLSPDQLAGASRASLVLLPNLRAAQSASSIACVPVERVGAEGSSTWTLQTYHSPLGRVDETFKTPEAKRTGTSTADRRAPPPPPILIDMPLPPTPTVARSSTLWDGSNGQTGKDSMELLMSGFEGERDWVEVESGPDGFEEWGSGGKGVGVVAVLGSIICFVSLRDKP